MLASTLVSHTSDLYLELIRPTWGFCQAYRILDDIIILLGWILIKLDSRCLWSKSNGCIKLRIFNLCLTLCCDYSVKVNTPSKSGLSRYKTSHVMYSCSSVELLFFQFLELTIAINSSAIIFPSRRMSLKG